MRKSDSSDRAKKGEAEMLKRLSARERMILALYLGHRWSHFSRIFKVDDKRSKG